MKHQVIEQGVRYTAMKKLEVLAIQYRAQDAETIEYMLKTAGQGSFSLSVSRGLFRGLALLKKNNFAAVLLDFEAGDRGAVEAVRDLHEEFPAVPVIVLVHARQENRAVQIVESGAVQDYLVKERLTPDLLVKAIGHAAERNRLMLENTDLRRDRERLEEEIRQLAPHDPFTGLPNRALFIERLMLERDRANRMKSKIAVIALSVDAYQSVRDGLGGESGQLLVREAAVRITSRLRKSDTVARLGSDVFGVILPDIIRPLHVADVAHSISTAFRKIFLISGHEIRSTASIGASIYPDDGIDIETLFGNAEHALQRSREELGAFHFFDRAMTLEAVRHRTLEAEIRRSVTSGELSIYYQPLLDSASRNIVCAEALARWAHPERGLLPPSQFIPTAEETGLIAAIDEWVIREVMRQARVWLDAGLSPVCVTVNVSYRQLHDPNLIGMLRSVLKETEVPAGCLYLEVSEKTAMRDIERTAARLRELDALGIPISIDGFGSGYSSLNHLERLPVKRLKIDKSFIRRVPADPDHRTMVRSVTSLAHNMRMKVVAEGIETEDQLRFVRATGCDEMQGYLFSKPLPAAEFTKFLAKQQRPG